MAAVVFTVTLEVVLVALELRLTGAPAVHVGRFVALAGVDVIAHDSVIVPA